MSTDSKHNVPITETWQRSDWSHWDTYQGVTSSTTLGRTGTPSLGGQQHVDVRTFIEGAWTGGLTTGYIGPHNWPAGRVVVPTAGGYLFTSAYTQPIDLTPVGSGTLSLALPNFPLANIDLTQSALELSSDGFASAICTLPWSQSTFALTSGNTTLAWSYSSLTGIDLTRVTGVRLRVQATGACTITFMALRLLGNAWAQTNVDFDSINGQLRQCVPVNGDPSTLPVAANAVIPVIWRSDLVPGGDDPRPINAEMSVMFNTGSQTASNSFTLYMREAGTARITQLDLRGQTQAALNGKPQPTSGVSLLSPRTVSDLDQHTMGQLDGQSMANLDAVSNPVYSSWVSFNFQWGSSLSLHIAGSSNPNAGYLWSGPTLRLSTGGVTLNNNTTYLAVCNLTDFYARFQLYTVTAQGALGTLLFDTTAIPDSSLFSRRAGRIGLQCSLSDGDAYIGAVRPRGLMFAEYRSTPFNSATPVRGARLYADFTPNNQLFSNWSPNADANGNAPTLVADRGKFSPLHAEQTSTRVTIVNPSSNTPAQGVISNVLTPANEPYSGITNFAETSVVFDIWFPSSAMAAGGIHGLPLLTLGLVSPAGATIPIPLPRILPDQWQTITLTPPVAQPWPQSGLYQLVMSYQGVVGTTFWLDNLQVFQRVVKWSARSVVNDAWGSNYAPWTEFHELTNSDTDGVVLQPQGKQLQMRGQALQQNGAILGPPKLVPIYAELGRLIWADTTAPNGSNIPPTATFTTSNAGRTYTFGASGSTAPNGIANYLWAFGDGTFGSGAAVTHTYALPGTYAVNLTVYDRIGLSTTTSTIVAVT